jgi:sec-independent protein translocase protein TatC
MAFEIKDIDESQAPLLEHLIELRSRLMRCIAALAISFGVCFYFVKQIFAFLVAPLANAFPNGQGRLVYTKLYEAFFVELKVALFAGSSSPSPCWPTSSGPLSRRASTPRKRRLSCLS